jgi:hypothetical protein
MDGDGVLDQSWSASNRTAPAWNDVCASASRLYASHRHCRAPASCRYGPGHLCTRTRTHHSAADIVIRDALCAARSRRVPANGAVARSRFAALLRVENFSSALRIGLTPARWLTARDCDATRAGNGLRGFPHQPQRRCSMSVGPAHPRGCSRKNRTISPVASGPPGSVNEPCRLPPDQAWPLPCTSQCSASTLPSGERCRRRV